MTARPLSWIGLVWRHLWSRPVSTALNLCLLALGFAAITFVILISEQTEQVLQKDLAGIDLVVGAKGSPLQLILSGVFHLDAPTGNIPAQAATTLRQHPLVAQVIPLALGDSVQGHRIVGTDAHYPQLYGARYAQGQWVERPLQVVLGASVAREKGWGLGTRLVGSHGLSHSDDASHSHADTPFTVVGVLTPTGTVLDRLVLTPVSSVWQVHGGGGGGSGGDELHKPPPELTLLLIKYRSPLAAASLPRWVNAQGPLQSASPALESARLLQLLGVGLDLLKGFAAVLLLAAGLSVFMALTHTVRERQSDLALMRLLGAPPWRVSLTVMMEALCLSLMGALLGLLLGHGLLAALSWALAQASSLSISAMAWSAQEAWLPPLALTLALTACVGPTWRTYRIQMLTLLQNR